MNDQIYFRQLLAGRDFAKHDPRAQMMENFVYVIGDKKTRECVVIDPAWGVEDLVDLIEADGYKLTGALATHYHPDHVGGTMYGHTVEGLPKLMERCPCKVHANEHEVEGIIKVTGLSKSDFIAHGSGSKIKVGDVEIECLHTPGHTPGSQCFCVDQALISGDTLFLSGCGRVDLPGGDVDEMYYTLTQRMASLPGHLTLYPGHAYGGEHAPLNQVRATNPFLNVGDLATWRRHHGLSY
jgi:glyoxylase-like metal-dependent hydrolase (beta-lactamase superfamily II)